MHPKVSIIIPTYNREKLIKRCIESALKQTYRNIEIIAVDNCSTDNTFQMLQEYANSDNRVRIFKNKENIGPVRNWERGIREACGEYIKILWSDDWISENFIEKTLPLLEKDKNVGFVYTPVIIYGSESAHLSYAAGRGKRHLLEKLVNCFLFDWVRHPSSPGNAIFRAQDVKENLLVDIPNGMGLDFNRYGAGNDRLLFLKCFPKYKYYCISQDAMSHFLSHDESFSTSNDLELYYRYSVKYFVEEYLRDEKYKKRFNLGLYWTNKFNRNKFAALEFKDCPHNNPIYLCLVLIGRIFNRFREVLIWKASETERKE